MRRESTEAERKLWAHLRREALGVHFRRQVAIGPYVADFLCHQAKIIIELDGSQHLQQQRMKEDAEREGYLRRQGYRVIRFNNNEIAKNLPLVLQSIFDNIQKHKRETV